MKLPVDPHFPVDREDQDLLAAIADIAVRPVFIMGLHRSGTTFLYDCVARCFPLARLSLYHLFYYQRLLVNQRDGTEGRDKDRLNRCFKALGIENRHIDAVAVDADNVEEYGFLLRQISGSFQIGEHNRALFGEICRKLLAVQAGSQAVALKNPWDCENAESILRDFPNARFIYITREPIAVLNSRLNACLAYLDGPQYYLELLLGRGQSRRGYRVVYALWWLLRGLRRLVGTRILAAWLRPLLARELAVQVVRCRKQLAALPADRAKEIDFQQLTADPIAVMRKLTDFLDLPLAEAPEGLRVRERRQPNPRLLQYEPQLLRLIERAAARS